MVAALVVMTGLAAASLVRTAAAERSLYQVDEDAPVERHDRVLTDELRDREVPVRIYRPAGGMGSALPLVVFSPGLGASRQDYGYLAEHLASRGVVVVVVSHPDSDSEAWRRWLRGERAGNQDRRSSWIGAVLNDPAILKNRPLDVSLVIDELSAPGSDVPIDTERIGVAGHSLGAATAMAAGGMLVDLGEANGGRRSFRDPRVGAVVAMSPQGPGTMGIFEGSWDRFDTPVMLLTGTRDHPPPGRPARWRRSAFDRARGAERYLVTLAGATHLTFGGRGAERTEPATGWGESFRGFIADLMEVVPASPRGRAYHLRVIEATVSAFFDSYLDGQEEARRWLDDRSVRRYPGVRTQFEPQRTLPAPAS